MKKHLLSLLLAATLSIGLLVGCTDTAATEAEPESTTEASTAEDVNTADANAEETSAAETSGEITLESIAALNGIDVSELNTLTDEDGNIIFVGDKLSDEKINDKEDAFAFVMEKMGNLLNLDNIALSFGSSYESPNTEITYYRFNQTLTAELEAKFPDGTMDTLETNVEYLTNSLKLGVDADGLPVVLVSDISYGEPEIDPDDLLTPEEAEKVVTTAHPEINIYSDATALTLWEDTSVSYSATDDRQENSALVYLVYADNPELENDEACMPYVCYYVRADGVVREKTNGIVAELACDSLSTYSYTSIENTSLPFFDEMEDAGEYTYTVNFDWMPEEDRIASEEYAGGDSLEITVPVMKSKKDGLYYLGLKEHYISMSNAADFYDSKGDMEKYNPYVTENPEDLNSWHFKKAVSEKRSCTYEDDPNYVLASFAEYEKVIDVYGKNFNMYESYPTDSYMLLTYVFDPNELMYGESYPSDASEFFRNACNGGRTYDWNTFLTSPALGLCLDDVVMCHEFTHGVNSHFTNSQYANEMGAVMEAFADMVGYQTAAVYLNPDLADGRDWLVGGSYGPVFRNLSDPISMHYPEYIGGVYYANPVDRSVLSSDYADNGGVHENSLVASYLGKQFLQETTNAGEEALTLEDSLKMWFETLYLSNYSTDYVQLGADLKFAAKQLGFSEEKQAYLEKIIQDYGFAGDAVKGELLNAEDSKAVSVQLDFEDESVSENYYLIDYYLDDQTGAQLLCGGFTDNKEQEVRLPKDMDYPEYFIVAVNKDDLIEATWAGYTGLLVSEEMGDQVLFHVKKREVPVGEALTLAKTEAVVNIEIQAFEIDESEDEVKVSVANPDQKIVATKEDGMAQGEYNLYIVDFK